MYGFSGGVRRRRRKVDLKDWTLAENSKDWFWLFLLMKVDLNEDECVGDVSGMV